MGDHTPCALPPIPLAWAQSRGTEGDFGEEGGGFGRELLTEGEILAIGTNGGFVGPEPCPQANLPLLLVPSAPSSSVIESPRDADGVTLISGIVDPTHPPHRGGCRGEA